MEINTKSVELQTGDQDNLENHINNRKRIPIEVE